MKRSATPSRREERVLPSVPRVHDNRILSDVRGTITIDTTTRETEGPRPFQGYWGVDKKLRKYTPGNVRGERKEKF